MNTRYFHTGSFLIGLLAGVIVVIVVSLNNPAFSSFITQQGFTGKSDQLVVNSEKNLEKAWNQTQTEFNTLKTQLENKVIEPFRVWFNKNWNGAGATIRNSRSLICTQEGWLNRISGEIRSWLHIQAKVSIRPGCAS
jgi:hypothetical protein